MDATLLVLSKKKKKKAPAATADDAAPSSAEQAVEPLPSPGVKTSGGEDDDEQVEKFYALLDNIRAMRGMVGASDTSRKRAREAEPPWRPAFRMEDFELEEARSDDEAPCCGANKRSKRRSSTGVLQPTVDTEEGQVEVAEAKDPRPAQRKHARRTGVLAADS